MGEKMMTLVELRDAIAKAIADAVGNGMREKYERHAEAALTVVAPQLLLTAKHAESDHLTQPAQAVDVTEEMIGRARDALFGSQDYDMGNGGYIGDDAIRAMLTAALPKDSNGAEGV